MMEKKKRENFGVYLPLGQRPLGPLQFILFCMERKKITP